MLYLLLALMGGKLRVSNPADCLVAFRTAAVTAASKAAASKSRLPAQRDFKSRPPAALPKLWISSPGGMPAFEAGLPDGFQGRRYRQITGVQFGPKTDRLRARANASSSRLPGLTAATGSSGFQVRVRASKFRVCRCHGGFPSRCSCKVSKSAGATRSSGPVGAAGVLGRCYQTAFKAACLRWRRGSRLPTWRAGLQLSELHLADGFQGRPLRLVQEARFPRLIALRLSEPVRTDGFRNRLPGSRKRARENQVGCRRPSEPLPAVSSYLVGAEARPQHARSASALNVI